MSSPNIMDSQGNQGSQGPVVPPNDLAEEMEAEVQQPKSFNSPDVNADDVVRVGGGRRRVFTRKNRKKG